MAQLKDLIVTGATRLIGNAYAGTIQITTLNAPTAAGGTTYGPGTNGYVLKSNGSSVYWGSDNNSVTGVKGNAESSYRTGQVNLTPANIGAPTTTGSGASGTWGISITGSSASCTGNAATATKLQTAHAINGTNFDGSADITTANWGTARTITIGDTGKSVNGSADVSWTKTEILGSGNTGQFLRGDHNWSNTLTGSFYAGTADTISEYQIRVTGGAGSFYLYSQPSSTGDRGIYSIDASNNSLPIITATNDNMVYFGHSGIAMDNNPSNYGWKQFVDSNHTTVCSRLPGADAFSQCAIEIRENNEIAAGQSSIDYAPKLGFHWSNRCAGFIALNSSNWFDFKNQGDNGWKGINVGGLTSYNNSINVQLQNVDASLANNNISETIYPTSFNIVDYAGRILTRQEAVLTSDGVIKSFWYVRNYNTSGNHIVQKGITLTANKDGSFRADCSSPFYGAVWNDYAEYRESNITEPGRCIKETGNGDLVLTVKRLEKGCEIISDTFGFAIGQSNICKTPTAVTGRVLAYLLEPIEEAKKNIGQAVCSGPNGTVSIMTDEECRLWPQCIIGTISEIPDYKIWHAGMQEGNKFEEIQVNGRVWIRIR